MFLDCIQTCPCFYLFLSKITQTKNPTITRNIPIFLIPNVADWSRFAHENLIG